MTDRYHAPPLGVPMARCHDCGKPVRVSGTGKLEPHVHGETGERCPGTKLMGTPDEPAVCMLCGKVEGSDLDDYFVFDEPIADRTFAPARYVTGKKMLPVFEGAKGRPIHAHYGCVGDLLWRRQASTEVETLERVLSAIGGASVLPSARAIIQRMLTEAQGRSERDQTIVTKLRELQAERWRIVARRGAETLHLDELVSGEGP